MEQCLCPPGYAGYSCEVSDVINKKNSLTSNNIKNIIYANNNENSNIVTKKLAYKSKFTLMSLQIVVAIKCKMAALSF